MNDRIKVCEKHPERKAIFELEQLLSEAGVPYFFNFWEDLRPTPFNPELDPESINWDNYGFLLTVGEPVNFDLAAISVTFNTDGDSKTLELLDMTEAAKRSETPCAHEGTLYRGLDARSAAEIIKHVYGAK